MGSQGCEGRLLWNVGGEVHCAECRTSGCPVGEPGAQGLGSVDLRAEQSGRAGCQGSLSVKAQLHLRFYCNADYLVIFMF